MTITTLKYHDIFDSYQTPDIVKIFLFNNPGIPSQQKYLINDILESIRKILEASKYSSISKSSFEEQFRNLYDIYSPLFPGLRYFFKIFPNSIEPNDFVVDFQFVFSVYAVYYVRFYS